MRDVWTDLFDAEFRALSRRMDKCGACQSLGVCKAHRSEWWSLRDSEKLATRGVE